MAERFATTCLLDIDMMLNRRTISFFCGLGIFLLLGAQVAGKGSTPRLNLISPRGVERGSEHVLRFSGERLSGTQQIFLYAPGVEVIDIEQIDNQNVDVRVKVESNCRLGEHIAQIRTTRGISDFRSFFVGDMPHHNEVEPNNELQNAQPIELNNTILGVVDVEDVDIFKLSCEQGQRLNVEIEAVRLGTTLDSFIAVVDENNFELAISDDSRFATQDGLISLSIPKDGNYFVLVRDASYGGQKNGHYRLHVGNFPRPQVAFPPGGQPGQELEIEFLDTAGNAKTEKIKVASEPDFRPGIFVTDENGTTPSPVAFRISELENFVEAEPNNDRKDVMDVHTAPCAFNGVIGQAGDYDYFRFTARKGENLDVECFARRLRSGLDPVINIFDEKGKHIVGDDDARRPDCYLRFDVPADGDYFVRVRDHLDLGEPTFVYRIELSRVAPSLSISIPRVDRYSQLRQKICVPQGNRFATMISAVRSNFSGKLKLNDAQWPAGITVDTEPMAANLNLVPVVFSAAKDAPLSGSLVDLKASHVDDNKNIVGNFSIVSDFVLGNPNNAVYFTSSVDKLACAVTKRVPFSVDIVQPKVPVVRNGSINLKIVVNRDEGFDKPINVQFPFRPPGIGTRPQVQIKEGQTEGIYALNANGSAPIGKWPVYVIAQASVSGPVWVSSRLAKLDIAEPFVIAEMNRTVCERGKSANVFCKLKHRKKFEGEATAELLGVPPHIEIPKLTFTSDTTELNFPVTTSEQSPLGKHKGLFCRVTIHQDGEQIVSNAGRSELHINPVSVQSVVKDAPKPAKAKPMSRLEQLRAKRQESSGK